MYAILVFSSLWCKVCPAYKSMLTKNDIEFADIDVEEMPGMVEQYGVKSVPTTIITKRGVVVARFEQITTAQNIKGVLKGDAERVG